ncbi:hypothetical protein DAEQUDRAFT_729609 [Daedalea quercina L-15889]|uniref:Uncharacterized protein n=1 Tax=Daedalea quercina L-15889 TaxID=1314783 RepID=A0A165NIN1_9APHY|nr:hypothetical protein DAEQUDRAFT_729609 [Daedalea quercina L-15889]
MAATLAMSLLGHVLFLKSQVPFPVVQLARMPGGQSNSRAAKRRNDLLAAIDTLSSHMQTTFTALSTALARRRSRDGDDAPPSIGTAHLAFVLGPSVGAARARIIYTVNGLELKVWGERDDVPGPSRRPRAEDPEESEEEEEEEDVNDSEEEGEGSLSEEESEDSVDSADEPEDSNEDSSSEPPLSRSPSPSPPASHPHSHASSPTRSLSENIAPPPAPRRAATAPPASVPSQTYAEEQQTLRTAERLLSRTLANACADDSGGMSSELAPTQTHVLLRAPRRFAHPAWIPRQNLTRSLEGTLQSFLDDACSQDGTAQPKRKGMIKGVKIEGVWVGCRSSDVGASMRLGGDAEEDEEDEMIWWVWNGKIVGFSDW